MSKYNRIANRQLSVLAKCDAATHAMQHAARIVAMTRRQHNIRQFLFREMIASHDARICKAGHGPMILTWAEARNFWRIATNGARSH